MDRVSQNKIFTTLGASNHSQYDRADLDFYATDPKAVEKLVKLEEIYPNVWEPAACNGHIAEVLSKHNFNVLCSDIVEREYGLNHTIDFLKSQNIPDNWENGEFDIVTNPPYNKATEFVLHSLDLVKPGRKIIMFLKLTFLEGAKRAEKLFSLGELKKVWVFSKRVACARNGEFNKYGKDKGKAVYYAWFVWEKGYKGLPQIDWIK